MNYEYKHSKLYLTIITAIGFILRIIGFTWGSEGAVFHPDEPGVVEPIMDMISNKSLIHSGWLYPSMCSSKLIAPFIMAARHIVPFTHSTYYYSVRLFYVIFSTAIIVLSYMLVKKAEGERTALIFSVAIAINPSFIKMAKMAVGDTPVLVFWLLLALCMQKYLDNRKILYLVLMSVFAACATLEKWNGTGITILIAAAVIWINIKNIKKLILHGIISLTSWIVAIIAIAPNIVTECRNVIESIFMANGALADSNITAHFELFLSYFGLVGTGLLVLGLYIILTGRAKNENEETWLNAARFPYMLMLVTLFEDYYITFQIVERHGLPIYWGCTLILCISIEYLVNKQSINKKVGITIVALLVVAWLASDTLIELVAIRSRTQDTRSAGIGFLDEIGANINNSVGDIYTPYMPSKIRDEGTMAWWANVDSVIYMDGNTPCISWADKKYAIVNLQRKAGGSEIAYEILTTYGEKIAELESTHPSFDLFMMEGGQGGWNFLEIDTIKKTWSAIKGVYGGDIIGPPFEVYNISSFTYKPFEK